MRRQISNASIEEKKPFSSMECTVTPQLANAAKVADQIPPARQARRLEEADEEQNELFKVPTNVETFMGTRYLFNLCRFLGVFKTNKINILYASWSFIVNVSVTVYLPAAFFISFMSMSGADLEIGNFLTSLQAAINDFACVVRITILGFLLPKLLSCDRILKRLDKRCSTKAEIDIIKSFIESGNRIVLLFAICYCCYILSTCLSALIFHRLPFNIYIPLLDTKASIAHFSLAFFIEALLATLAILQEVVNDSYPIVYVSILRTHLNLLLNRIENFNNKTTASAESIFSELKLCIIDHQNILEIYNIVAPIISISIFVQFTVSAVTLGITLINILIFATDFAAIIASSIYVFAMIVQIFPLCYCAQSLKDESLRLSDVIFHSNWTDQDIRYRKMLIFFIQRSQRTIDLTAGKMFPITLSSFVSIAKFSFSLYTFIVNMGLKERFVE